LTETPGRAVQLASQFEAANEGLVTYIQSLSATQWLAIVPNEERTVAALAHHVAWAYAVEIAAFEAIAHDGPAATVSREYLDTHNAREALEYAECDLADTIALLNQNATHAASVVASLTNEQLRRKGQYADWAPPLTVDHWIRRVLIGHIDVHLTSIRDAISATAP
jgi:hypothetical protein